MTALCWFQPQADPPRRAFFIRAPEAMGQKPYNLEGDDGNGGALHEDIEGAGSVRFQVPEFRDNLQGGNFSIVDERL